MRLVIVSLALGIVLLLSACATAPAASGELTIKASDFKFEPAALEVKAGQLVKLRLHNQGSVEHDFSIMEIAVTGLNAPTPSVGGHDMEHMGTQPQLHIAAMMGQSNVLHFTPSKAGTYQVFCSVPGHKEAGMTARLTVKAP